MHYEDEEYKKPFSLKTWFQIWPFAKPYQKRLGLVACIMVANATIDVLWPVLLAYVINHFIVPATTDGLLGIAVLAVVLVCLQAVFTYVFIRNAMQIEVGIGQDLRRSIFGHLQKLGLSYYNTTPVGYMMARTLSDTFQIGDRIAWSLVDLSWSLFYIGGVMVAMLLINVPMALIVIAVMPLLAIFTWWFQTRILRLNRQARRANSRMTGAMNEGITGARTSKSLAIEELNDKDFYDITAALKGKTTRIALLRSIFLPLVLFVGTLATSAVLAYGGFLSMQGVLMLGTLAAFIDYSLGIFHPVQQVASVLSEFVATQANIERVFGLLGQEPMIVDPPEVVEKYGDNLHPKKENWEPLIGDVEFKDVTFMYPDGHVNVLENFNLHVKAGSYVAIVGETGAGKSTLVNLVCRFFEPTGGVINIDGRDMQERSQLWLHSHLGYVLQNPHLFSGSVRENIRYGRLEATDEEVEAAARMVSADKIIETLEKGWDTDVGEGGSKLSTGQKQLLSLARAVLADPRIFILDEATSSIDTETEALIQHATATLLTGRTSFVIAHRLSTIRGADEILVVSDGKIVERGTHKSLMAAKGGYYELYTRQFEEEAAKSIDKDM